MIGFLLGFGGGVVVGHLILYWRLQDALEEIDELLRHASDSFHDAEYYH